MIDAGRAVPTEVAGTCRELDGFAGSEGLILVKFSNNEGLIQGRRWPGVVDEVTT
jgi:hypothetical protein